MKKGWISRCCWPMVHTKKSTDEKWLNGATVYEPMILAISAEKHWNKVIKHRLIEFELSKLIFSLFLAKKPVVIVSDIRRNTDIKFFQEENYNIRTIRIETSDAIRKERGWIFQKNVDDVQSECDLDNYDKWDFQIVNDGTDDIEQCLTKLAEIVENEIQWSQ